MLGKRHFTWFSVGKRILVGHPDQLLRETIFLPFCSVWLMEGLLLCACPGHGKFESIGALGISGMLLLTGGGIAWHALESLQV